MTESLAGCAFGADGQKDIGAGGGKRRANPPRRRKRMRKKRKNQDKSDAAEEMHAAAGRNRARLRIEILAAVRAQRRQSAIFGAPKPVTHCQNGGKKDPNRCGVIKKADPEIERRCVIVCVYGDDKRHKGKSRHAGKCPEAFGIAEFARAADRNVVKHDVQKHACDEPLHDIQNRHAHMGQGKMPQSEADRCRQRHDGGDAPCLFCSDARRKHEA